jgi:hypothetical protein
VHFTGASGHSSEEEEQDDEEDGEEAISFEDMLEQARAQSDICSAEEDSDDEDFEPYVIHCEDYYTEDGARHFSLASAEIGQTQEGDVCAFTSSDCTAQQQPGIGSGGSCSSSARGMSMARNTPDRAACDAANAAAAPASGYTTRPRQLSEARCKGQHSFTTSRWERLSPEEKVKKKKGWENRKEILKHFEIPPYSTPPRTDLDVSLESDNNEEDQEVLDNLDHEEEEEVLQAEVKYEDDSIEQGEAVDSAVPAQEDVIPFCHPCKGNVCYCEDERQVIFIKSNAKHQEEEEAP